MTAEPLPATQDVALATVERVPHRRTDDALARRLDQTRSCQRHWHLGPLVVDTHLQGMGVGGRLMQVFCAQIDAAREDAYLETDKPENVTFYERFGFEVIGEQKVFGVINYFMLRRPEGRHG